ncbi:MAG: nucleotide-binding protein [Flavobacteriales bacterium]|nr:nucleotide-binding protein [Flavobacteriales bacterium]
MTKSLWEFRGLLLLLRDCGFGSISRQGALEIGAFAITWIRNGGCALIEQESERSVYGIPTTEYEENAFGLWLSISRKALTLSDRALLFAVLKDFFEAGYSIELPKLKQELKPLEYGEEHLLLLWKVYKNAVGARTAVDHNKVLRIGSDSAAHTKVHSNKVFIVHGHDKASRLELEQLLRDELDLDPIVLQDSPNDALETILSKVERLAGDCHAAIVLMTPDDVVGTNKRPRQNVVLELGYFIGRWKPKERRIIVVRSGDLEAPSDMGGILYLDFKSSPKELYLPLRNQFRHWGFSV